MENVSRGERVFSRVARRVGSTGEIIQSREVNVQIKVEQVGE